MDEKIEEMLDEEIRSQIRNLSTIEDGTKEKTSATENLVQLYKLKIENMKIKNEAEERRERCEIEKDRLNDEIISRTTKQRLDDAQFEEQIKDRRFRIGIAAAEIILPLVFYAVWMNKGFRFEQEGTFTSTTFRNLINRFKPTKK